MTVLEEAAAPVVAERAPRKRSELVQDWWRYLVGLLAIVFAVVPILYVISAAFNSVDSLSGSGLIPESITLDNFRGSARRARARRRSTFPIRAGTST